MAKGKVTVKSLKAGQTVYRVCGRGGSAFIETLVITSRPYRYKNKDSVLNGTLWVNSKKFWKYKFHNDTGLGHHDNFSLSDAGIEPTKLIGSVNRTFYKLKAAQRWLAYAKSLPEDKSWDDYDLCSPMDDVEWDDGDPDPAHWHGLNVM